MQLFHKSSKKSPPLKKATDKENSALEYVLYCLRPLRHAYLPPLTNPFRSESSVPPPEKTEKEIQDEIQSLFRQITASVTFLPQLDGNCTFNVLVYADADSEVPVEWGDSDAKEIKDGEKVQLRSFSTSNHKIDTMVSYRMAD